MFDGQPPPAHSFASYQNNSTEMFEFRTVFWFCFLFFLFSLCLSFHPSTTSRLLNAPAKTRWGSPSGWSRAGPVKPLRSSSTSARRLHSTATATATALPPAQLPAPQSGCDRLGGWASFKAASLSSGGFPLPQRSSPGCTSHEAC